MKNGAWDVIYASIVLLPPSGRGIYTSPIRERIPLDTIDFGLLCERPGLMAFSKEGRKARLGGETG